MAQQEQEPQDHQLDFPSALAPPELAEFDMDLEQRSHLFGYEPSPPQYLNIDEARETLSKKISARPSREELMKLNILKEYHSAPQLHATQRALQRAKVEDTLQRRIPNRPSREALQAQNILKSTTLGPVIQSSREALARASLTERLNETIAQRPGIMDLVLDQIFQTEPSVFELVASEAIDPPSEVATPMPDSGLPDFDLLDAPPQLLHTIPPPPPPPPIPPPAWNIASMSLPTTQASLFGLPERGSPLGLDPMSAAAGAAMPMEGTTSTLPTPQQVRLSAATSPASNAAAIAAAAAAAAVVVSASPVTPMLDPLVRRPTETKVKKFRYHEYKYPAEKPKRPNSQTKRRTPKAMPAKPIARVPSDEQVLLPAGVGYETAIQQQARFLRLMQQAQEAPVLPNFGPGPGGYAVGLSPGSAQSPLHDLLLDAVSPNTPAPQTPDHHFRPGSAAHSNISRPAVVVPPRAANPAPSTLEPPRAHGHSRASSWGGGIGKTSSLPLGFVMPQAVPAVSAMPTPPRSTPQVMRTQSMLAVQPHSSPLAGPPARGPPKLAGPTHSLPQISFSEGHMTVQRPLAPTTSMLETAHCTVPPLSISTTLASHPPPHELGDTSFGMSFQFEDTFTNIDSLPDFDFSSPMIMPDMHPV